MNISVIASTHANYVATKEELEIFSGHKAGVCYMPSTFGELVNEPKKKTEKRVLQTKSSGHHSVYDHASISMYLENIPKALAMVLNNEKQYTTSEKSARYTKMELTEKEQVLFDKWLNIFKTLITEKYQEKCPTFFSDSRIEKLAQENARYLISIFTPTSMVYTTTYRQLNNLYHMMKNQVLKPDTEKSAFEVTLNQYLYDFCKAIESYTPYIDDLISGNEKSRKLSLFGNFNEEEYYGTVYATNYKCSFACLAQAQRHRTLNYTLNIDNNVEFYVPKIIRDNQNLVEDWLNDCNSLKENYPQGMLVNVNEYGMLDNFVLKMMERKCTFAQLEINDVTNEVLHKYVAGMEKTNHPRFEELKGYTKGARCTFSNYTCTAPCGFKDGIVETRLI